MGTKTIANESKILFSEPVAGAAAKKGKERDGFYAPQEQPKTGEKAREDIEGKLLSEMKRTLPAEIYGKYGKAVAKELSYAIVQLKYENAVNEGRSKDTTTTLYNVPEKTEEVLSALREIAKCDPKIIKNFMDAITFADEETEARMFVKCPRETVDLHKAAGGKEMGLGYFSYKTILTAESLRSLAIIAKTALPGIKDYMGMQGVITSIRDFASVRRTTVADFANHHQMCAVAAIEAKKSEYIVPALENLMRLIAGNVIITPDRPESKNGFDEKDIMLWSHSCAKYLGMLYSALNNKDYLTPEFGSKQSALYEMNQIITSYGLNDAKICMVLLALGASGADVEAIFGKEDANKMKAADQKTAEAIRNDFKAVCRHEISEDEYLKRIKKY